MLRLCQSVLGAALTAGLAMACMTPTQSADARPFWGPHGHWVHGWHGDRFGWWWAGPGVWYWYPPAPAYYVPPPPEYLEPASPAPERNWYYCDSAKGYYPHVRTCSGGWRAVPATPRGQRADAPPVPPPATSKS
jgi:hypothetical protein